MKKKAIIIGFILGVAFFSIFIPRAKSSDYVSEYAILAENLQIDYTEPNGIRIEPGAPSLEFFDPLGFVVYEDNVFLFKSKVTFELGLNAYSDFSPFEAFNTEEDYRVAKKWLDLETSRNFGLYGTEDSYDYYARFSNWRYLDPVVAVGINGYLPITFSVVDLDPQSIETLNGTKIMKTNSFEAIYSTGSILSASSQEILEYSDYWQGDNEIELTAMSVIPDTVAFSAVADQAASDLQSKITSLSLGVTRGDEETPITKQQGRAIPASEGSLITSNGIFAKIIPDIKIYREEIKIRHAEIMVDTKDSWGSAARIYNNPVVSTSTYTRNIGWHVKNYIIRYWIEISFNLYSYVELSPEFNDMTELGVPDALVEDMYWDTLITGDTDVSVTIGGNEALVKSAVSRIWGNWKVYIYIAIGLLVILGGGYVFFIYIYPRMAARRKAQGKS